MKRNIQTPSGLRKLSLFFISRFPADLAPYADRHGKRPKWYSLRFPQGAPLSGKSCGFWVIWNAPSEAFPSARPVTVRIYKDFVLFDDFIQPDAKTIEAATRELSQQFGDWGCGEYEKIKSSVLANLLSEQDLAQYSRIKKTGDTQMQLEKDKLNLVQFHVIDAGKAEILDSGSEIVTNKDDFQYRVSKAAKHASAENAQVTYQVLAHYDKPAEASVEERIAVAVAEALAKK